MNTNIIFKPSQYSLALSDLIDGLKNWRIWLFLSWQDVKLHYRRSALGPLWITLSMGITVLFLGLLYGKLFKMDLTTYFPFLTTGMLIWSLISSLLNEGVNMFIDAENFIKQMKQPYSTFILRFVTRVFIIFFHNSLILLPIFLFFPLKINASLVFLPLSLFLIWLNGIAYGTILSILSTRYRDLKPIVSSLVQVVFFITPVLWSAQILSERSYYVVKYNPFAQFIDLLREPLLGRMPSIYTLEVVFGITIIGLIISFFVFAKYRSRISYWL